VNDYEEKLDILRREVQTALPKAGVRVQDHGDGWYVIVQRGRRNRTFEIPAARAFNPHERAAEIIGAFNAT